MTAFTWGFPPLKLAAMLLLGGALYITLHVDLFVKMPTLRYRAEVAASPGEIHKLWAGCALRHCDAV